MKKIGLNILIAGVLFILGSCHRKTELGSVGSNHSADSIKAVYEFYYGTYLEIPHGNPGSSSNTYYVIELKKLMLYKKFIFPGSGSSDPTANAIAIAIAITEGGLHLHLPEKAKVVFQ